MKKPSMSQPRTTVPLAARDQRGVVLIIALVMLVVISLLATFSIRNALSSEGVSGNVRTTQLATQAAEVALRYCEDAIVNNVKNGTLLPSGMTVQPPVAAASAPLGVNTANWDGTRTGVFVIPTASVNLASATFARMPECVSEQIPIVNATANGLTTTSTYLITARGFGPEVASGTGRPEGSEVWMQSTLEVP
ncbi:PilX N-terminal domain-containing pilus assembly protein [Caenimonas terrae]|uniref:PilX N-terminal domain-containing pilus assembly protein n=1 Tax=Caenimonas terrae TaxID=696074 RepID=A0ABW0NFT1_9BURK